jgi:SAM-dependent methyltransferase
MKDLAGRAIADFYAHKKGRHAALWIHNNYGQKEEMPVEIYFRSFLELPEQEYIALKLCRGNVLDVGAGAGSHALVLQNKIEKNVSVTALDISRHCCEVMKVRGVKNIRCKNIFKFKTTKRYDTLLLLMNGIGLCGTLDGLKMFLIIAEKLLTPNGQLIFDSSDVGYLYNKKFPKPSSRYYGEVDYCYEYKKEFTDLFSWLYIDKNTLQKITAQMGWTFLLLHEDKQGQYLVKLTK